MLASHFSSSLSIADHALYPPLFLSLLPTFRPFSYCDIWIFNSNCVSVRWLFQLLNVLACYYVFYTVNRRTSPLQVCLQITLWIILLFIIYDYCIRRNGWNKEYKMLAFVALKGFNNLVE